MNLMSRGPHILCRYLFDPVILSITSALGLDFNTALTG